MIRIRWLQQITFLVLVFMFFPCLGLLHSTRFDVPAFQIFAAAALKYALTRELCHAWTVPIFQFLAAQCRVSHSPNKAAVKGFYQSRIRIVVAAVPKLDGVDTSITHWFEIVGLTWGNIRPQLNFSGEEAMDWDFMLNHRKNSWSKPYPQRLFGSIAIATIQWHVLKRRAMMHSYIVKLSYASEGMYVCPKKFIHWDARNIWCLRNICTVKYVHPRKVCTVKYVCYDVIYYECCARVMLYTMMYISILGMSILCLRQQQ